ncbi:MAG TPA: serine/threonine-protein kinase [Polyangiaceae bacterium]|nr:serine/threonine-protein kinase [Polyangiaceae bacterium]
MADSFGIHRAPAFGWGSVPAVGDVLAGKYRIEGMLGVGGMGVVLAARHLALNQIVAIKFLTLGDEERRSEATARLLREAKAAAALSGEHVVRTYDLGEDAAGAPFIVMERLEGADLGRVLERLGRIPVAQAVSLVVQACRAVGEAHRAGIVHRDLKPSNLFVVRRSDGKAHIKVLDFGISKSLRPEPGGAATLTGARVALGSPHYMSPEQVRDARNVDARTDIWSLGMILYELVTGKPAFRAGTFPGVCAAIIADPPQAPSLACPEVGLELEAVILKCLAKDVNERFAHAEALIEALELVPMEHPAFDALWTPPTATLPYPLTDPTSDASGARPGAHSAPAYDLSASSSGAFASPDPTQLSAGSPPGRSYLPERASGEPSSTQRSSTPDAPSHAPRARRIRLGWLLGCALALLAAAVLFFRANAPAPSNAAAPAAATTPAAAPQWLTLTIDSEPPGADVTAGPKLDHGAEPGAAAAQEYFGRTPLTLTLAREKLRTAPRVFVLQLKGYRPYVFEQGLSEGNVRLRAELVRETAPPLLSSAPNAPALSAARLHTQRAPMTRAAPPPSPSVAAPAPVAPEIRLSR